MKCATLSQIIQALLPTIILAITLTAGGLARADVIYSGTNFDIQVSHLGNVGNTPLKALKLTAIGTTIGGFTAKPSTFDSSNNNTGGTGITTLDNKLHQIYQHDVDGMVIRTPTLSMDADYYPLNSTELALDSHFLIHQLDGDPLKDVTVFGTTISENKPTSYMVESLYGGYGNYLRGGFFLNNATATSWDVAYLVVPNGTQINLNFAIAGVRNGSPVAESVITSFVVPEPTAIAMLCTLCIGLLGLAWRHRNSL